MLGGLFVLLTTRFLFALSSEDNLIQWIRKQGKQVNVSMSSEYNNEFLATYAIDGNASILNPNLCKCCAGTTSGPSWWRLDLGQTYLIKTIIFIGRSDSNAHQSRGFEIYNGFRNNSESNCTLVYKNNAKDGYNFSKTFITPVAFRHLEVYSPNILTICELELVASEFEFVNLSLARASMSSEYQVNDKRFSAHYAVDGKEEINPDSCFCCAAANSTPSSWSLDLGKKYLVQGLVFTGRNDTASYQSRNFDVFNGFSNSSAPRDLIYRNRETSGYKFIHYFSHPILIEKLEINSSDILTICEFKLIKAACEPGNFGDDCQSTCHCKACASCDIETGECPGHICDAGWKGLNCSIACDHGKFGDGCRSDCHCKAGARCNTATGECSDHMCDTGWKGLNCSIACDPGKFGDGCRSDCHCKATARCNTATGECSDHMCDAGWKGLNCSIACDPGKFGDGCRSECHCKAGARCNTATGECSDHMCDAGWKGLNCSIACDPGKFGDGCRSDCHCKTGARCNTATGECSDHMCDAGWKGLNCSIDINLISKIRSSVNAEINPVYQSFYGLKAIDNDDRTEPDTCNCCAGTAHGPSWWRLDLGNQFSIDTIIFIGRSDAASDQSRGFTIYDGYSNTTKPQSIYTNTDSSGYKFVIPFAKPIILQRLEIRKEESSYDGVLTVCEFKMLESDVCPAPYFDRHCKQECHCADQQPCNKSNGTCRTRGCNAGWKGASCNETCSTVSFGPDCLKECHCNAEDTCDRFHGNCSSGECAPGWRGDDCSLPCDNGTFGQNCSSPCLCLLEKQCDPIRGNCLLDVCSPGWRDKNCSTACESGKFGQNCSSLCHCLHGQHCDSVSGYCPSGVCSPGWLDKNCSTACSNNTYGQNCSSSCHCNNCHHISGSCNTRQCYSKWKGKYCNETLEALKQTDTSPDTAVIIGPIVAVLILGAIAAVLILYRRHAMKKKDHAPANNFTDLQVSKPTHNRAVQNKPVPDTKPKIKAKKTLEKQDEHMYYSYATRGNTIQIQDLWDFINEAYLDKCEKLHLEFQKLPSGLIHECVEANRPENIRKNRYKGIMAYDHSRVMLQRDDPSASAYVNACYIDGFAMPKKFIASQGPQENTADDFCEMVFQKHISLIVMLTNVIELGTRKCVQYWSADEGEVLQFGEIVIITAKITTFPDYIIRELEFSKAEKKPHRITQVHFTAWPDKDVPDDAWHLVNVWRKVNSLYGNKPEPIVVHCSAGVGRTGTYIALSNLHEQARAVGYIQPLEVITQLRNQRVSMVQTKDQYVFVHEAVAESLYLGVKPVKSRNFESVHTSLLSREKATGEIGLEQQFLFLQKNKNADSDSEYYNIPSASEIDEYRPKATPSVSGDRSDCMFIQNYTAKDTFMVSKIAAGNAMSQELQKTVTRNNIKTVISLSIGHRHGKTNPTDEDDVDDGDLLKPSDTKKGKLHMEKTFELKHHKTNHEQKQLKLFEFLMWRDGARIPTDPNHVIDLLNAVQRWQPVAEEAHPILVTCETGFERSGLICALLSEFERIRVKEEVNLFETVKNMKTMNSQFIPNYDQYRFCHAAVLEYIRQSDVYMNV